MSISLIGATAFFGLAFVVGVLVGYFAGYFTPRSWDQPHAVGGEPEGSLTPVPLEPLLLVVASLLAGGMLILGILGIAR